jgi:hypothetical protein
VEWGNNLWIFSSIRIGCTLKRMKVLILLEGKKSTAVPTVAASLGGVQLLHTKESIPISGTNPASVRQPIPAHSNRPVNCNRANLAVQW